MNKGDLIAVGGIWYIVVREKGDGYYCICDHANNIHHWPKRCIDLSLSAAQINSLSYGNGDLSEQMREHLGSREIPYQEMWEVLCGFHDDRFDHWEIKA